MLAATRAEALTTGHSSSHTKNQYLNTKTLSYKLKVFLHYTRPWNSVPNLSKLLQKLDQNSQAKTYVFANAGQGMQFLAEFETESQGFSRFGTPFQGL